MSREAMDFLLGAVEGKAVSFKDKGSRVGGTVLKLDKVPDTDVEGKVRTWPNGKVKEQVIITLQTEHQDDADDDGKRRVFVNKYGMRLAIADAFKAAHWTGNPVGGQFSLEYYGDEPPKVRGQNGLKLFRAVFTPPARMVAFDVVEAEQLEDHGDRKQLTDSGSGEPPPIGDEEIPF